MQCMHAYVMATFFLNVRVNWSVTSASELIRVPCGGFSCVQIV